MFVKRGQREFGDGMYGNIRLLKHHESGAERISKALLLNVHYREAHRKPTNSIPKGTLMAGFDEYHDPSV
jgi:hypothetical protein